MTKVTATEFQQNVGKYNDIAMREPVVITKQNRETLVLLSIEDYRRLKGEEAKSDAVSDEDIKLIEERMQIHKHTIEKLAQ